MSAVDRSTTKHVTLLTGIGLALAAVAWGLLELLQRALPSLHLRRTPELLIIFTIGAIALAIAQRQAAAAKRAAQQAAEAELDAALACWWPRRAAELSPYDLGAHPTGEAADDATVLAPYAARALDDELRRALAEPGLVVVYGPPRAGKTRTAYEAVRQACPQAALLVPEDADGLASVLARMDRLRPIVPAPYVLWLDELERFLPGIDLDALDRLTSDGDVRLVATIGQDALSALLAEGSPARSEQHLARRLLARARAIPLPAPSAAERQEVADAAAVTSSLSARLAAGWQRVEIPPAPRPRRRRSPQDWAVFLLAVIAAGLAVWTLYDGFRFGWTEPPPLEDQLARLNSEADACETLVASPADADPLKQSRRRLLVVVAHRESCLDSDELRLYSHHAGRLRELATMRPSGGRQRSAFACIGSDRDPCTVTLAGPPLFVGAFGEAGGGQTVPFALRPLDGQLRLMPLSPHRPRHDARVLDGVEQANRREAVVRFGAAQADADEAACDPAACVRGYPAQAWAAFAASRGNQAVIVGGYLTRGTPDAPRELWARARQLLLAQDQVTIGRSCSIFRHGARVTVVAQVRPNEDPSSALAREWTRQRAKRDSGIVC